MIVFKEKVFIFAYPQSYMIVLWILMLNIKYLAE